MAIYTREYLHKNYNISDVKKILCQLGGKPGKKSKNEIIDLILRIQSGEKIEVSSRGRRSSYEKLYEDFKPIKVMVSDHDTEFNFGDKVSGIFDIDNENYGFIQVLNFKPSNKDILVPLTIVNKYGLLKGDFVEGKIDLKEDKSVYELVKVDKINDVEIGSENRINYNELDNNFTLKKISLSLNSYDTALKMIDMFSPICLGQRSLIIAPQKSGGTTILKKIAYQITANHPNVEVLVLLVDKYPEDIAEFNRGDVKIDVISSSYDDAPLSQVKLCQLVMERAKRLVENGKDVLVLIDSITNVAKAFNNLLNESEINKSLIDNHSIIHTKKLISCTKVTDKGSLGVVGICQFEEKGFAGLVYDELKDIASSQIVLSSKLSKQRIFPAIDVENSSSKREEELLSPSQLQCSNKLRRMLFGEKISPENIVDIFNDNKSLDITLKKIAKL